MNPEYLRERTSESDFKNPWVIIIGANDDKSYKKLKEIYSKYSCPLYRLSFKEAEMQKYIHNLYNAAKISFFNEMRMIGEKIGFDEKKIDEIFKITSVSCEGIWNKKYGIRNMGPFSGSCLPKDTQAFLSFSKKRYNFDMKLLDKVIEVNNDFKKNSN